MMKSFAAVRAQCFKRLLLYSNAGDGVNKGSLVYSVSASLVIKARKQSAEAVEDWEEADLFRESFSCLLS